jgi:hypothetical protein
MSSRSCLKKRYGRASHARLTRASARPGTLVRVAEYNSMYRGTTGVILDPSRYYAGLGGFERRLLSEGAILVERRNGSLFVVPAHALERV